MKIDFSAYTKVLVGMLEKLGIGKTALVDHLVDHVMVPKATAGKDSSSSLARILVGAPGYIGEFNFPADLIGGCCPRVAGEEEEIVWNAAAEACDTERVHVVWQSTADKIWYLAVRSTEMASNPNAWCPFASLLPGMKDAAVAPVCYTYYAEDTAMMMTVTADSLQIYRGTGLVVRAKAERTSRELGEAPVMELVPDRILGLSPVPWYSVSLFEDRARRILAAVSVVGALSLAALTFIVWLLASMALITSKSNLAATMEHAQEKTMELMKIVEKSRASPMRDQLAKFADINDGILSMNGYLQIYEISKQRARWRAIVPANVTADRISQIGGKTIEALSDGSSVIGNDAEIAYEQSTVGKKP